MSVPVKILPRLVEGIKKFQIVLKQAKVKDINESDTVVIITDILSEIFGFEKYGEITSEYAIKKTFCDLAIKIDGKIRFLIEVKAIGIDLKTEHIRQAIDYGSNAGVDWVILSNGICWKVFKINFTKPISHDLVYEFDLTTMSPRSEADMDLLFMVSKESLSKSLLEDFHNKKQLLSKYFIGNLILSEQVVDTLRKIIKKISPEIKVEPENIIDVLKNEIIKREILDGDKADEAKKKIDKYYKSQEDKPKPVKNVAPVETPPATTEGQQ